MHLLSKLGHSDLTSHYDSTVKYIIYLVIRRDILDLNPLKAKVLKLSFLSTELLKTIRLRYHTIKLSSNPFKASVTELTLHLMKKAAELNKKK